MKTLDRDALLAEQAALAERALARRAQAKKDEERGRQIRAALHRLDLLGLVGVRDGVHLSCRYPAGHQLAYLNARKGTIVEVRRTRALVDFGDDKWDLALDDVQPASEPQGGFLSFR